MHAKQTSTTILMSDARIHISSFSIPKYPHTTNEVGIVKMIATPIPLSAHAAGVNHDLVILAETCVPKYMTVQSKPNSRIPINAHKPLKADL